MMLDGLRLLGLCGLASITLASACRVNTGPSSIDEDDVPVIDGDPSDLEKWIQDDYTILDARVTGDRLLIEVRFGGGCEEHEFRLIRGGFMESHPVQLRVLLAHDGHGDPCRALLSPTLTVDLEPIRDDWRDGYRQSSGTIILRLHGWDDELRYAF